MTIGLSKISLRLVTYAAAAALAHWAVVGTPCQRARDWSDRAKRRRIVYVWRCVFITTDSRVFAYAINDTGAHRANISRLGQFFVVKAGILRITRVWHVNNTTKLCALLLLHFDLCYQKICNPYVLISWPRRIVLSLDIHWLVVESIKAAVVNAQMSSATRDGARQ